MDRLCSPIAIHPFYLLSCLQACVVALEGCSRQYYTRIEAGMVVLTLKERKEATLLLSMLNLPVNRSRSMCFTAPLSE